MCIFAPLTSTGLSYGVMVTRQILVLKFWVRAPIAQHNKGRTNRSAAFVVSLLCLFVSLEYAGCA